MEKDLRSIRTSVIAMALVLGCLFLMQAGGVALGTALPIILGALLACVFFALTDLYAGRLFRKSPVVQSQKMKALPVAAAVITALIVKVRTII